MTAAHKYTIAAALVVTGVVGTFYIQSQRAPSASNSATSASFGETLTAAASQNGKANTTRPAREGIPKLYAELASRYGEAETRKAIALTTRLIPLAHEMAEVAEKGGNPDGAGLHQQFSSLSNEISLREDQQGILEKVRKKMDEIGIAKAKRSWKTLDENPRDVAEVFLAAAATKRGTMTSAEFDEVFSRTGQRLMDGDAHALDSTGLLIGLESNPFTDNPEVVEEIMGQLDPAQKESYRELVAEASSDKKDLLKGSEIFDLNDLDHYSTQISGITKILQGIRMTAEH